jgi:uncharacterized protein (TIGR03089 family)
VATGAGAAVVTALSLNAFGIGLKDLPPGVLDYATEVRLHGDVFTPERIGSSSAAALAAAALAAAALAGASVGEVLAAAREAAASAGLSATDRVLTTYDWTLDDGLVQLPLAVLAAGGSLVQCRNAPADPAALDRRATGERVTRRLP